MTALVKTMESIIEIDQASLRWVSARRRPTIDLLMRGFTRAGDWQTWTLLVAAALIAGGDLRQIALQVLPKLLTTLSFCYTIKRASRRPRPNQSMQGFSSLLKNPDPYSFPSSHSACAWVVCVSLGIILGGGWAIWIPYALAISYSRIHVGAHYPLDVAVGIVIGTALAFV